MNSVIRPVAESDVASTRGDRGMGSGSSGAGVGSRPISVTAFVDWNSQIRNANVSPGDPHGNARRTLKKTSRIIGKALARLAPTCRFSVVFRLYHGWYKGWEPADNFRAMTTIVSEIDFSLLAQTRNVTFSPNVQYGHALLSALPERRHVRPPIHLPNTLRKKDRNSAWQEKMVDTALAADLLDWAREGQSGWALVLSEDDDVVPPVLAAEAWTRAHGGRTFIVRIRRGGPFLKLRGLLLEMKR